MSVGVAASKAAAADTAHRAGAAEATAVAGFVAMTDEVIVCVMLVARQQLDTVAKGRTHGTCIQPNRAAVLGQGLKTLLISLRASVTRGVIEASPMKPTTGVAMGCDVIAGSIARLPIAMV